MMEIPSDDFFGARAGGFLAGMEVLSVLSGYGEQYKEVVVRTGREIVSLRYNVYEENVFAFSQKPIIRD